MNDKDILPYVQLLFQVIDWGYFSGSIDIYHISIVIEVADRQLTLKTIARFTIKAAAKLAKNIRKFLDFQSSNMASKLVRSLMSI